MFAQIQQWLFGSRRPRLTDEQIAVIAHEANAPLREALGASRRSSVVRVSRNHRKVKAFIGKVAETESYRSVGQPIPDDSAIQVHDWKEALASASSLEWENFLTDRHNERDDCNSDNEEDGDAHNVFVRKVRSNLSRALKPKVEPLLLDKEDQETVLKWTRSNMIGICIALAYCEVVDQTWTNELGRWYLRGHFPCGWKGDWPEGGKRNGKIIVY